MPVKDDSSSAITSQPPPGTPPAQTGDSVTTGDNDVPMDGDEANQMAMDEVIEDDSPMPCAFYSPTAVHSTLDELQQNLEKAAQQTLIARNDMAEFQSSRLERALGAAAAAKAPLLFPSSKKKAALRFWDNYSRESPKVARQAADDDASVSSAAKWRWID